MKAPNIHIMSLKQFLQTQGNHPPETAGALISTSAEVDTQKICVPCVIAEYLDVDDDSPRGFSDEQAAEFSRFVRNLPEHTTELYICCDAGESRSPAIAAAILRYFHVEDASLWNNPHYHPNMRCFVKMSKALGLFVRDEEIDRLLYINQAAFRGGFLQ